MAKQLRVISDEDWMVLKKLVEQNRNTLQNPANRPSSIGQYLAGDDSMAPEVYIALPPSGGIPALDSITAGTSSDNPPAEGDRPGHAVCTIYQIVNGELKLMSGLTKTVYNLSESEIAQDWILIQRDKGGRWVAVQGGSGASTNIKRGKLSTTLASGSRISPVSAIVDLWEFDGTEWTETDPVQQETVYDDGMVGDSNSPLEVGTWIQIVKIGSYWFYDGHNCDPSTGTAS